MIAVIRRYIVYGILSICFILGLFLSIYRFIETVKYEQQIAELSSDHNSLPEHHFEEWGNWLNLNVTPDLSQYFHLKLMLNFIKVMINQVYTSNLNILLKVKQKPLLQDL